MQSNLTEKGASVLGAHMAFREKKADRGSETIEGLRSGAIRLSEIVVHRADGSVPQAGVSERAEPEMVEGARGTRIMTEFDKETGPAPAERQEEGPGMVRGRRGTTIMTEFEEGAKAAPGNEDYVLEGEIGAAKGKKKKEEEWGPY